MFAKHPESQDIPALRQLWQEAFGDDDAFLDKFFSTGYHKDRCRVVMHDGQAAATLYWFDCQWEGKKLAYLYAVATAKAFQGQGLCRFLMEDTHQHLTKQGYFGAVLVPGSDSLFQMYAKMDYRVMSSIQEISCDAREESLPLTLLSPTEYACHRAKLLPPGGIRQEGASLDFLATYCAFYESAGSLLCVRKEGEALFAPEVLGNTEHFGNILHTLGCRAGVFRTPGDGKPFAMFRSFTEDPAMPTYLGHAFD